MVDAEAADRVAAESWFLQRGLPSVLTRRARWRRLWRRSAPALAGYATALACVTVVDVAAGGQDVDVDANPTPAQVLILAVLAALVPLVLLVTWLVSRVDDPRVRRAVATASVAAAVACAVLVNATWTERLGNLVMVAQITALTLVLNGMGVGSVLGWAVRLTCSHLAGAGALVTRALPVVLLTVLVFFNGFVWSMATKIDRGRMWSVVAFMAVIAIAFLFTGVVERTRPVLRDGNTRDSDAARLATPPSPRCPTRSGATGSGRANGPT
ncbi:hypothetical protein JCM12141A_39810 [Mycolicibacterium hodleri]